MSRPLIALSMGDPAGIGPEVLLKAATVVDTWRDARMAVFGDVGVLRQAATELGIRAVPTPVEDLVEARTIGEPGVLPVVAVSDIGEVRWGEPSPASDGAQLRYIERAVEAVRAEKAEAFCTAPISKLAIHRAGSRYSGHTDMLGDHFGVKQPVMMLAGPSLKVIPLTVHVPLSRVPELMTRERVETAVEVANETFRRYFALPRPRIAVAGLNPHAGENGMFGREEEATIIPAVAACAERGIDVRGPFAADSVFHRALTGEFDVVIGMYHDQALIPLKLIDFDHAVNVTLGLPIVRTSVDHGTAYDIAGQGVASASSMMEAIRLAARMARTSAETGDLS